MPIRKLLTVDAEYVPVAFDEKGSKVAEREGSKTSAALMTDMHNRIPAVTEVFVLSPGWMRRLALNYRGTGSQRYRLRPLVRARLMYSEPS